MTDPSAIVVGGGLAGMVVARELALRRWRVILLERSKRIGGKAGSDIKNGRPGGTRLSCLSPVVPECPRHP